ncbi:MAG: hypothetical protein CSA95_08250 [Bacteroidetes bacterium]|nr:MAG: hypothetical protein CSA95_08250 [Bacteroidota bacterium]
MHKKAITFLHHHQINKEKWDQGVSSAFNTLPYAESWYLDIVSPNWGALVGGDYEQLMPLPIKQKYGIPYLIQPLFVQQLGIFSRSLLDSTTVEAFLDTIPKKYVYINLNLNSHNQSKKFSRFHLNHELDLVDPIEHLRTHYSTNLKRNLKKAKKAQLSLMKNLKPEAIVNLFREDRGREIDGWKEAEYRLLLRLLYSGIHKNRIDTYGAFSTENELITAAVFLKSQVSRIFLFSGNSKKGKEQGGMPFLLDQYIAHHTESNLTLDFEGSNDKNLARFYRSFGSTSVRYPSWQKTICPFLLDKLLFRT